LGGQWFDPQSRSGHLLTFRGRHGGHNARITYFCEDERIDSVMVSFSHAMLDEPSPDRWVVSFSQRTP
jgi:hypothetical protein